MNKEEINAIFGVGGAIVVAVTYYLALWVAMYFSPALAWLVPFGYFIVGVLVIFFGVARKTPSWIVIIIGVAVMSLGLATLCGTFWNVILPP